MHDVPYAMPPVLGPETYTAMTAICNEVRRTHPDTPMGIQILSAANKAALAVALASGKYDRTWDNLK